jgi:hypothetical protein
MRSKAGIVAAMALLFPGMLAAQLTGFEVRGGVGQISEPLIQVSDGTRFGDGGGRSLGATAGIQFRQGFEVTAGFSSQRFSCAERCTMSGSGLDLGLRAYLGGMGRIQLWGEGGLLLHRLLLRDLPPEPDAHWWSIHNTEPGRYFGGGAAFRLTDDLVLQPGVRVNGYRVWMRPLDEEAIPGDEERHDVRYTTFEIGLRFTP